MSKLHRSNRARAERAEALRARPNVIPIIVVAVCLAPWAIVLIGGRGTTLLMAWRHGDLYGTFLFWKYAGPVVLMIVAIVHAIRHRNDPRPRRRKHEESTYPSGNPYGGTGSDSIGITSSGSSGGGFSSGGGTFGGGGATGGW